MTSRRWLWGSIIGGASTIYVGVWQYRAPFEPSDRPYFWNMPWHARLCYLLADVMACLPDGRRQQDTYLWQAYASILTTSEGAISAMATDALVHNVKHVCQPLLASKESPSQRPLSDRQDGIDRQVVYSEEDVAAMDASLTLLLSKPHVGESIQEEWKRLRLALDIGPAWLDLLQHQATTPSQQTPQEQFENQESSHSPKLSDISSTPLQEKALPNEVSMVAVAREGKWRSKFVQMDQRMPLYLPFSFRTAFHDMVEAKIQTKIPTEKQE